MSDPRQLALISVRSSNLRNGLYSLMRSCGWNSGQIICVEDPETTFQMVCDLNAQVVVLDTALYGPKIFDTVRSIHRFSDQATCVVLADEVHQRNEAKEAGAELTVLKGYPAPKLAAAIAALRKEEHPVHYSGIIGQEHMRSRIA